MQVNRALGLRFVLVMSLLLAAGCSGPLRSEQPSRHRPVLTVQLQPDDRRPVGEERVVQRPWTATGLPSPAEPGASGHLTLEWAVEHPTGRSSRRRTLASERLQVAPDGGRSLALGDVGRLRFDPAPEAVDRGTVRIELDATFVDRVQTMLGQRPSLQDLVEAGLSDLRGADLEDYAATGVAATLRDVVRLRNARVAPEAIAASSEAGYAWDVSDLVRLTQMRVSIDDAVALRAAGYELDPSELIRLRQMRVPTDDAAAYRQAGFTFTVGELIRLRQMNVERDFVLALAVPEGEPLDAEEIINLRRANIDVRTIERLRGRAAR
jgi:hypothetical protein